MLYSIHCECTTPLRSQIFSYCTLPPKSRYLLSHTHTTHSHTLTQKQLGHRIHLACGREGTCHPAILHQLRRTTVSHGKHSRGQWCGPISSRLHPTATHRHDTAKRRTPERPAASTAGRRTPPPPARRRTTPPPPARRTTPASPARRSRTTPTTPARCTSTASPERRSLGTSSASAQRQLKRSLGCQCHSYQINSNLTMPNEEESLTGMPKNCLDKITVGAVLLAQG